MRTSRLLAASASLILGACATPPPPGSSDDVCAAYASRPDVYAVCVTEQAQELSDPQAVRASCARLPTPPADAACRRSWVDRQLHQPQRPPASVLLDVCADMPDCAFAIIDDSPPADVLDRVGLCRDRAGPHARDCAGHALQAWAYGQPDEVEVQRVIAGAASFPHQLGDFVGMVRACQGRALPRTATYDDARAAGCPTEQEALKRCLERLIQAGERPEACTRGRAVPPP